MVVTAFGCQSEHEHEQVEFLEIVDEEDECNSPP
jgi:hypothetical protein